MSNHIVIKGIGHPDTMTNSLADTAINSLESFNKENGYDIYGDFSNSYLKGGKFPTFTVGGYMPFDFRKYSKELRYEIFNYIKNDIIGYFKSVFPEPTINIQFDLNLEPSNIKYFIESNLNVETVSVYIPNRYTEIEQELLDFKNSLRTIEGESVGKDFMINLYNNRLIIEQTFSYADEDAVKQYVTEVESIVGSMNILSQKKLIINNDFRVNGNIKWSRYGSTIFHNGSSTVGNGNDHYGFKSSVRPFSDCIFGKSSLHPSKFNLNSEKETYLDEDKVTGYIVDSVIGEPLGVYNVTLLK